MRLQMKAALLAALGLAQLTAAAWSIVRYETTLRSGTLYKIRVAPVDPADPFRGRYVAVQPSVTLPTPVAEETRRLLERVRSGDQEGYVVLAQDGDGFARAERITGEPPPEGDYLRIDRVREAWSEAPPQQKPEIIGYMLGFAFDRYYMNETAAPRAERRFRGAALRDPAAQAWLTVRVRKGVGVIEGLFVDGTAIEEVMASDDR